MVKDCSVEGCTNPAKKRGWCSLHYQRWWKHGDLYWQPPRKPLRFCSIKGCDRPYYSREWCKRHYEHWFKWGDPLGSGFGVCGRCGNRRRVHTGRKLCKRCSRHSHPKGTTKGEFFHRPVLSEAIEDRIFRSDEHWHWNGEIRQSFPTLTFQKKEINIRRYLFEEYRNITLPRGRKKWERLVTICDEKLCVNPVHHLTWNEFRRIELLAAGHRWIREFGFVPSEREWDRHSDFPNNQSCRYHFGKWTNFIQALGLSPTV